MGPIERELRDYPEDNVGHWTDAAAGGGLSWDAFHVLLSASVSLGIHVTQDTEEHMSEVLSEAIEAAAELGL